jgi:hypothetical protein
MNDITQGIATAVAKDGKQKGNSGWYVLLTSWVLYASVFFAVSKGLDTSASDITNFELRGIADTYGAYVGVALGLLTYLVTGIAYLALRLFRAKDLRLAAFAVTAAGYAVWLAFGYDLVYVEPRFTQIANVIITYLGTPMLYSSAIVVGAALLGVVASLILKGRTK